MILDQEIWMDIRRFKALHECGTTYAEIGREYGVDYRTVKKYLAADAPSVPPAGSSRSGTQPRAVTAVFEAVIRGMLKADVELKASVVHERLVSEHGFFGHYQRVKAACRELRPLVEAELDVQDESSRLRGLHRRFEVLPGAQSQVDWGHEGDLLGVGVKVYSFHMTLSFSRDPFRCYVTSMDTATWWACHRRAFEYFGGVPASIVYDRTATIVRRHVAPGKAVPLQPEAVAFAGHYGLATDVLAAFRSTGKGRVERYVEITRDHVLAGRSFATTEQADAAFLRWAPIRRSQVHRTYGEVIGVRAALDHAALSPVPETVYVVTEAHSRRVGKDCLISFAGSLYSVPARMIRAGQRVEVRPGIDTVAIRQMPADGGALLATHPRAARPGSWVVD
jgi:transposase